jgi:putative membrane protein
MNRWKMLVGLCLLLSIFVGGCSDQDNLTKPRNVSDQGKEEVEIDDLQPANKEEKTIESQEVETRQEEQVISGEEAREEELKDKNKESFSKTEDQEAITITEKMYVSYINDIYTNPEKYLGKRIQIEGMYTLNYYDETDTTYHYVYRVGPGCCGNDGSMCGFEFLTTGDLPVENDWIEVVGTLEQYEENGDVYLTLNDSTVTVKQERGKENVNQ